MTDTYASPAAEPAPAPPPAPPPSAPEPSPAQPSGASFDSKDLGAQYQGERLVDGHPKIHQTEFSAAKEWARTKRERNEQQGHAPIEDVLEQHIEEIGYLDGRGPDVEVDPKTAAAELSDYRAQRNAQLKAVLDELEGHTRPADPATTAAEAQSTATPIDEYQAAREQHAPVVRQNIQQLREALEQQETFARSLGLEIPPGPHQEALNAGVQAAEAARQNYEMMVTAELLGSQQAAAEFNAIRTPQDLERFKNDPAALQRFANWDAQHRALQNEFARVRQEGQQIAAYQQAQIQQQRKQWADQEQKLFEQAAPEYGPNANPQELAAKQQGAVNMLQQVYRFDPNELAAAWRGDRDIPLQDHRVQLVIRDAMNWRNAQAKALQAQTRPVPMVQRPGVAQAIPRGEFEQRELSQRIDNATGDQQVRLAAQLVAARRAAARR